MLEDVDDSIKEWKTELMKERARSYDGRSVRASRRVYEDGREDLEKHVRWKAREDDGRRWHLERGWMGEDEVAKRVDVGRRRVRSDASSPRLHRSRKPDSRPTANG